MDSARVKFAKGKALEFAAARMMDDGVDAIFGDLVLEYRESELEAARVAARKAILRLVDPRSAG